MTWHWLKGAFGGGEAVGGASGNAGGGATGGGNDGGGATGGGNDGGGATGGGNDGATTGGGNDGAEYGQLQLHARWAQTHAVERPLVHAATLVGSPTQAFQRALPDGFK